MPPFHVPLIGKISPLLDPSRIALQVPLGARGAVLHDIAHLLEGHPDITSFPGFYGELLTRDRLDTTCLGHGIALPHARTTHVQKIVLAVGRLASPIPFDQTGDPVRLFFVLGTPKSKPGDYLTVLSTLCKLLRDPANRDALMTAETPAAFIAAIVEMENKLFPPE